MTSFLKVKEVDMEREVLARTAAREESMGRGQGFLNYHCTGNGVNNCGVDNLNFLVNSDLWYMTLNKIL